MKTLILQTHSSVNEALYQLTLSNHVQYAGKHGYDMLQINMPYSFAMEDWGVTVQKFLSFYEVVFTVGSDVIFSNMETSLDELCGDNLKGIHISLEDTGGSAVNADTIIWRAGESCDRAINRIRALKDQVGAHPWGMQHAFNILYAQNPNDPDIDFVPLRKMQSVPIASKPNSAWKKGDFSIHFLAEDNEMKYKRCKYFLETGSPLWR